MKSYRKHIIEVLNKRRNLSGSYNINVKCPECETQQGLQRGAFSVNDGGGLWRTQAYCRRCGWEGVYLYFKEEKIRTYDYHEEKRKQGEEL